MATATVNTVLQTMLDKEMEKKFSHNIVLHVQSGDKRVDFAGAVGSGRVDSPYFIASATKMYTVAIIMQLVDEGIISLDALVNTYLDAELLKGIHIYKGADYSQQLKVYQLIHQTSGLADYFGDKLPDGCILMNDIKHGTDLKWDLEDVLNMTRQMQPKFAPDANDGKKSHYSDTNYQLLGAIIEAVTGKPVADVYQERICEPLGLSNTYLYDYQNPRDGEQPLPFYFKDDRLNVPLAMSSFKADGSIVSTLSDSMRFLRAYFAGELFSPSHFPRMTAQWNGIFFPLKYGYGLIRFQLPRWMTPFRASPALIGHSGASGAFAFSVPDKDLYIVGTFNQIDALNRSYQFMLKVINAVQ